MVPVCSAGRWKDKYLVVALPYSWNHSFIKDPLEQSVYNVPSDKQPSRLPPNHKRATSHPRLRPDSLLYPQTGKNLECMLIDSLCTPQSILLLTPYLLPLHLSRAMVPTPLPPTVFSHLNLCITFAALVWLNLYVLGNLCL